MTQLKDSGTSESNETSNQTQDTKLKESLRKMLMAFGKFVLSKLFKK